jgi:hypothetical protein
MKPESKIRRYSRCLARLVQRLWHLAWIIWHESEMRLSERAMEHGKCLKHAKKQLHHIKQIEATFPLNS